MEVHLIYDPKRFVVKFYKWLTEEISDGCRFSRVDEGLSFITLISSRTSEITNRRARSWHGDQGHLDSIPVFRSGHLDEIQVLRSRSFR